MEYILVEEASGAIYAFSNSLEELVKDAKSRGGKYLVIENNEGGKIVFDSKPGVTYKI